MLNFAKKIFSKFKQMQNICEKALSHTRKYTLISHLGFWSENFFVIAPFPDHCLNFFMIFEVAKIAVETLYYCMG